MKLLIFDFDGPINNLIEAKRETIKEVSEKVGVTFSEIASWGLINYIDQIYETEGIYDYQELVKRSLERLKANELLEISQDQIANFSSAFAEVLSKHQTISQTTAEVLRGIKKQYADIQACIYTSQKSETVQKMLEESNIDKSIFGKVYGREYFDEPKPSVVNLIKICEEFEVEPKDVISVGDNVAVDLAPASYLGMKTLLVNQFVGVTITSIADINQALQKLD